MRELRFRLAVAVMPLVAACGGTDFVSTSAAVRAAATFHDFCAGAEIPVWAGAGNPGSARRVGTLALGGGTAILELTVALPALAPTVLHLQFADALAGIPVTSTGNPIPGQFACRFPITPTAGQTVFTFDLSSCPIRDTNGDGKVFAAAHLGFTAFSAPQVVAASLPNTPVTLTVSSGYGPATFFPQVTVSGDGAMNGTYGGWCGEFDRGLTRDVAFSAMLYSSYDSAAMASLAHLMLPLTQLQPQNLPQANYIINRYANGDVVAPLDGTCAPAGGTPAAISFVDIQRALWYLLEGTDHWGEPSPFVQAMVCDATVNGSGFVPGCNQQILIAAVPLDGGLIAGQTVLIPVQVPCASGGDETAWADGYDGARFPGARQWGTYFEYNLSCTR